MDLTDSVMITYGYLNGKLYNMTTPLASHYDTDKDEYEKSGKNNGENSCAL